MRFKNVIALTNANVLLANTQQTSQLSVHAGNTMILKNPINIHYFQY